MRVKTTDARGNPFPFSVENSLGDNLKAHAYAIGLSGTQRTEALELLQLISSHLYACAQRCEETIMDYDAFYEEHRDTLNTLVESAMKVFEIGGAQQ